MGCAVACGAEVLINYGAKGNGELLRCHGFVLDENPCDVYELDLSLLNGGAATERTQQHSHDCALSHDVLARQCVASRVAYSEASIMH